MLALEPSMGLLTQSVKKLQHMPIYSTTGRTYKTSTQIT
ncbi:hypothetical protein F383_22710 [Gossypium arboreum]|uniref:Uncharacterized protein n=1 Tax=Gossypium arboreum TaxID=29729 RepID=A0A0B0NU50_GOSAR|nr:hypothetical protein F383_22710 [Gossypium arboreum]